MVNQIVRLPAVLKARGICRTAHYGDINKGLFTRPVALGMRAKGWPQSEVEALVRARIAAKSDAEIRALVRELEAARISGQEPKAA